MELSFHLQVLILMFVAAILLGAVATKTNFCTMGAVSDWVNMGDTGRMRAWLFAIGLAGMGVVILEAASVVTLRGNTMPPYRTENFAWLRYIVGGFIFGVGMTLGGGCGNKTLLRIGGGNLRSIFVALMIGIVAYLMFTTNLFNIAVMSWVGPTIVDLRAHGISGQGIDDFVSSLSGMDGTTARVAVGSLISIGLIAYALASRDFRGNFDHVLAGIVVGLVVVVGWYVTGGSIGQEWVEEAFMDGEPNRAAVQSFTFISPIGDTFRYLLSPTDFSLVRVGVVSVFGVVLGSFLYSILSGSFRIEWFSSFSDFASHIGGGLLMGFGGFMAMGCTIGQGVTGVSTLALGSFLALGSIIAGSVATMKVQYAMLD